MDGHQGGPKSWSPCSTRWHRRGPVATFLSATTRCAMPWNAVGLSRLVPVSRWAQARVRPPLTCNAISTRSSRWTSRPRCWPWGTDGATDSCRCSCAPGCRPFDRRCDPRQHVRLSGGDGTGPEIGWHVVVGEHERRRDANLPTAGGRAGSAARAVGRREVLGRLGYLVGRPSVQAWTPLIPNLASSRPDHLKGESRRTRWWDGRCRGGGTA